MCHQSVMRALHLRVGDNDSILLVNSLEYAVYS